MLRTVQENMAELIHYITDSAEERSLHGCSGDLRKLRNRLKILNTFISKPAIAREVINDIERLPYMFADKSIPGMVRGYVQNETERPFDTDCVFTQLDKTVLRLLDTVSVCQTTIKAFVNSTYELPTTIAPDERIRIFQKQLDENDVMARYPHVNTVYYDTIKEVDAYLTKEEIEIMHESSDEYNPKEELEDLKKLGWIIPEELSWITD